MSNSEMELYDKEQELYIARLVDKSASGEILKPVEAYDLSQAMENNPELYRAIYDVCARLRDNMIAHIASHGLDHQDALRAQVAVMKSGMGYGKSPELVKALIENVLACWLRLQYTETKLQDLMDRQTTFDVIRFWDDRLSAAHRRYLQACETLARVTRLTIPNVQLNVAAPGAEQINVAGDLIDQK
jgi:hypothetical protein